MTKPIIIPDDIIVSKIYLFRNQKVMIDSDLAALYHVETKRLNEQVKRNLSRFPEDFMFQLTKEELGRKKGIALCLYRTWNFNAFKCFE